MFYRFKHRFLTGWLRLLYSLRIKWKIYYASHLAQIVIWFFQIVFCCSYIVPYHHMLISPYLQVNQFHVFHIWNFAINGRHYSGNIKVRMRRKIFQLQRNFVEFFFLQREMLFYSFSVSWIRNPCRTSQMLKTKDKKLMCLHSTASKIINKISTMPMVQNILRMCADDSNQQGTCYMYWLCKTEQLGVTMVFSDNENC